MSVRRAAQARLALILAAVLGVTAAAAEDDNAEVVPLPEEKPAEQKAPPKPPPEPPKPVDIKPPPDTPQKPPKETLKEPAKETPAQPPEEPAEVLPQEAAKAPPKEPAQASSTEAVKKPAKEETARPEPVKPPRAAPVLMPPEDPGENTAEPVAETVPLPAVKPATPSGPPAAATDTVPAPDAAGELSTPALTVETPTVLPGQAAVFSLYGPEAFLRGATGRYVLRDEFGRQLAQGVVKIGELPFSEGKPRQLKVEVKHPLGQQHLLELALTGAEGKQAAVRGAFAVPRAQTWDDWIALIATPPSGDAGWAALRSMGIRGGLQYRLHPARREALRKGGAPFYVEGLARQLLSRYHTERGLWEKTIAAMRADTSSRAPLMREPSLCSQEFAEAFARELKRHAEVYAKDPPLFYSLACEPSVTRLSAAADFDFSPSSIQEFQRWLERDVYGTLKALNASWDTQFSAWTDVVPMTTDEARLRLRDGVMSFGPWVDFRDFQDYTFSKVLRDGAEFLRQHDPQAKVGLTGALGPSAFGGWDWSRLAQALAVVEAYDIGGARALWRDLAPGKPALAALPLCGEDAQGAAAGAARAIWSLALEGGPRGVLLWDESPDGGAARSLLDSDGKPTPLAQALAPLLQALDGETGALLANAVRQHDGVALLYSPASVRLHWLFEAHRLHGDKWLAAWGADTAAERRESPQLRLRESWGKLLDDLGLSWRFISSAQVESKEILKPEARLKTIVLPRVIALSDREVTALRQFVAAGGQLVADAACGRFDEHGRMRDKPALDEVFGVDTSTEAFVPQPMNPLERLRPEPGARLPPFLSEEVLRNLAPVFSDRPKWLGVHQAGVEYRRSPVLAAAKGAVYLNLDLTDYLRWRLHPPVAPSDKQGAEGVRAQAVREAVGGVAFAARLAEGLIDRQSSSLPAGTQVLWLQAPGATGARLLALRRNPQTRLHELGRETDGNWLFEKAEPFTVVLREPAYVEPLAALSPGLRPQVPGRDPQASSRIEGVLDPVTPALFALNTAPPKPPKVTVPASVCAGEVMEVNVEAASGADPQAPSPKPQASLFSVRLFAPDGSEKPYHALTKYAPDGALLHAVPLALNEPAGAWTVAVRDLTNGGSAVAVVEVRPAPARP